DIEDVFDQITTEGQRERFFRDLELDFVHSVPGLARFRVNVMLQRGTMSIAFRRVPFDIPTIEELGLPQICKSLVLQPRGLILVTGPTGSGKSTTLAAMIDYLNENQRRNVITIEDPIEYLYKNKKCILAQRDLGEDTQSFASALIHALRHDPDVILVGEMRDLETIGTAITAAETGHLVLGTLHTVDAVQTVDRIIDAFPPEHQRQIRLQVAQVLLAVLSQTLLPRSSGKGRIAAFEILVANPAVRNLIRLSKTHELPSAIQLGANEGMQSLNQTLARLVKSNTVTEEVAVEKSSEPNQLEKLIRGY
ncbi:MAG: type IV pilus twitching motility protein PilT, partial [Chloroflexota bacterium]|nr:type IV pilus twitching motility protein PilT [Chloroflexota bacterium]